MILEGGECDGVELTSELLKALLPRGYTRECSAGHKVRLLAEFGSLGEPLRYVMGCYGLYAPGGKDRSCNQRHDSLKTPNWKTRIGAMTVLARYVAYAVAISKLQAKLFLVQVKANYCYQCYTSQVLYLPRLLLCKQENRQHLYFNRQNRTYSINKNKIHPLQPNTTRHQMTQGYKEDLHGQKENQCLIPALYVPMHLQWKVLQTSNRNTTICLLLLPLTSHGKKSYRDFRPIISDTPPIFSDRTLTLNRIYH